MLVLLVKEDKVALVSLKVEIMEYKETRDLANSLHEVNVKS